MEISIESRGRFTGRAEATLFKLAKTSVKHFFKECNPAPTAVHLLAFSVGVGGNPHSLIRIPTTTPDLGNHPVGVPVVIFTEGTQGLTCLMSIPGIGDEMVRELVRAGPYCFKKRNGKVVVDKAPEAETAKPSVDAVVEVVPTPKLTPLERLRATEARIDNLVAGLGI